MPTACARNYASYFANAHHAPRRRARSSTPPKKFLAYITSPEAMQIWLKTVGELPARRTAALTDKNLADPIYGPFLKGLEYAHTTLFVDETAQRQIAIDMVNRVLLEGQRSEGVARRGRRRPSRRSSTRGQASSSRQDVAGSRSQGTARPPRAASGTACRCDQKQVVWAWSFLAVPILFYVGDPLLPDARRPSGSPSPTGTC